jgi:hypothetical protein
VKGVAFGADTEPRYRVSNQDRPEVTYEKGETKQMSYLHTYYG